MAEVPMATSTKMLNVKHKRKAQRICFSMLAQLASSDHDDKVRNLLLEEAGCFFFLFRKHPKEQAKRRERKERKLRDTGWHLRVPEAHGVDKKALETAGGRRAGLTCPPGRSGSVHSWARGEDLGRSPPKVRGRWLSWTGTAPPRAIRPSSR